MLGPEGAGAGLDCSVSQLYLLLCICRLLYFVCLVTEEEKAVQISNHSAGMDLAGAAVSCGPGMGCIVQHLSWRNLLFSSPCVHDCLQ